MNRTVMTGKWRQTKGAVNKQWGKLTDDDVRMLLGEGEQLVGRLQERYGYSRERAEREVSHFLESLDEELPLKEARATAVEAVDEHRWIPKVLFVAVALLVIGYVVKQFVSISTVEEGIADQ